MLKTKLSHLNIDLSFLIRIYKETYILLLKEPKFSFSYSSLKKAEE